MSLDAPNKNSKDETAPRFCLAQMKRSEDLQRHLRPSFLHRLNVPALASRGEERPQFEDVLWEIIGEFVGTAQGTQGEPIGARYTGQPKLEALQD
jgi:hypothetical protein